MIYVSSHLYTFTGSIMIQLYTQKNISNFSNRDIFFLNGRTHRALRGCALLGRWQDSIEILVDLLSETEKPGPTVFELTLEALVAEEQVRHCAVLR